MNFIDTVTLTLQIIGGFSVLFLVTFFLAWAQAKMNGTVDITEVAHEVCKVAFDADLPRGWGAIVVDAGKKQTPLEKASGYGVLVLGCVTPTFRLIELFRDRLVDCRSCWLNTLVHECLHAIRPKLRHSNSRERREFDLIVQAGVHRVWKEVGKCDIDAGAVTQGHGTRSTPAPSARLTGLTGLRRLRW